MAQSIQPYYGELLVSAVPLELSLIEPCDYGCVYCFAVLGDRHHAAKTGKSIQANGTKETVKLIQNYRKRKTLEATLLQQGYPVLLSNRTDPFGRQNRMAAIPVIELMVELGIPVAIQTKGFANADDRARILEILPPSVWYISIAFWDDAKRAKVEPAAPSLNHRLDLIADLKALGHQVVVGINPCVPEFLPDPKPLISELKRLGVWGVWVECLHLDHWQEKQLKPRERSALGQPLIDRAKKKQRDNQDMHHFEWVRELALAEGLEVYSMGQPNSSRFWDAYKSFYPKHFPVIQDFVNHCHETLQDGDLISFSDFWAFLEPDLPPGILQTGHYIGSTAHQVCREMGKDWTNKMTYRQLLTLIWCDARIKMSPANFANFSYAMKDGDFAVGDDGLPLMAWASGGHESLYFEV